MPETARRRCEYFTVVVDEKQLNNEGLQRKCVEDESVRGRQAKGGRCGKKESGRSRLGGGAWRGRSRYEDGMPQAHPPRCCTVVHWRLIMFLTFLISIAWRV